MNEPEVESEERELPIQRVLALLLVAPAAGAALGLLLLVTVLLPNLSLGDLQRVVELARHLDAAPPAGRAVFIGDSVVRDGIDAALVAEAAPAGWQVENLALSGCGLNERRTLLPKLIETKPAAVVVGLAAGNLCRLDPVGVDKGFTYAYAGYVRAWPPGFARSDFPEMSVETWEALGSSRLDQWLHFRTILSTWFDHRMRIAARSDLRSGYETDWIRPYTRSGSITGPRLQRHVDEIARGLGECEDRDAGPGRSVATRLVREIAAAGARPVLMLLPVHPLLRPASEPLLPDFREAVHTMAGPSSAIVVDATGLLEEDDFADAVHPNAEGRAALSALVGRSLPPTGGG